MIGTERHISDGIGSVDAYMEGLEGYRSREQELQLATGGIAKSTEHRRLRLGAELQGDLFDCGGLREDIGQLPQQREQFYAGN